VAALANALLNFAAARSSVPMRPLRWRFVSSPGAFPNMLAAGPMVGFAIERLGYRPAFVGLALLLVIGMAFFFGLDRSFTTREESGRTVGTP
jgi:hypothetical protein